MNAGDRARVAHQSAAGPYAGVEVEVVDSEELGGGTRYIVRDEQGVLAPKSSASENDEVVRSEELPQGTRYVVLLTDPNTHRQIHAGFMADELEVI